MMTREQDHAVIDGFAALMRRALSGDDLGALGAELLARETQASDPPALMDLSTLLHMRGTPEVALGVQGLALARQQLFRIRSTTTPSVRLLVVMVPGDLAANTPIEYLVEESDVSLHLLYVAPALPMPAALPEHDVVFVAVGEADTHRPVLTYVAQLVEGWSRPVLNHPDRIVALSRDRLRALLGHAPGLVVPTTVRVAREALEGVALGSRPLTSILDDGGFPVIVRPLDSQAGKGLAKVDRASELVSYLATRPEAGFFVARFVDYRSADGLFRKYRIVFIDGKPFASHMAASEDWAVYYIKAGMTVSPERRAEEARFMETFDDGFARRHAHALRAIAERTQLDYVVMDCAETVDGELLVFEIDNSAVVHALDPVHMFPYKHVQMRKVFGAFRAMLLRAHRSRHERP